MAFLLDDGLTQDRAKSDTKDSFKAILSKAQTERQNIIKRFSDVYDSVEGEQNDYDFEQNSLFTNETSAGPKMQVDKRQFVVDSDGHIVNRDSYYTAETELAWL